MSTVTVTQLIEAPATDLWRALTEITDRVGRFSAVHGVELLTPGPFGAGTVWREVRTQPDGSASVEEFLVVESVPPHRLVLTSAGTGADYRITYTLTGSRPGRRRPCTTVTVVQESVPAARYGRVLALILGGLAARTVEGALRRDLDDLASAACSPDLGSAAA
ncbi:SRPBCC family protein [Micromonospora echinofusca]|uniref:SRPBCC family protein n=1 Tax=Micromonospora echinofusca TaxID=47858 RepID=A0ABS3VWT5_MICEH|nr:SRPBCC family protein [Micromonospora echinofusca]MBO4208833.1 SRPBCC family protein [Micromonospora echinofusca]